MSSSSISSSSSAGSEHRAGRVLCGEQAGRLSLRPIGARHMVHQAAQSFGQPRPIISARKKSVGLLRWPAIQGLVFDLGNNGRSQSLSVGRAALLMRAHERLRGRPYTLALALRADVALGSPFALASMDPRHVWLPAMCGSVVERQS